MSLFRISGSVYCVFLVVMFVVIQASFYFCKLDLILK